MTSTSQSSSIALTTLLGTDLVESTRLTKELGDIKAARLFGRHDEEARALLRRFDGKELEHSDGLLCVFDRPSDAVEFSILYHRKLQELSTEFGVILAARVGINIGEVVSRETSAEEVEAGAKRVQAEGLAIPITARVVSLGFGGQTLLTQTAFDLARRGFTGREAPAEKLTWLAHGPYRMKGLEDPLEIFEVGIEGEAPLRVPMDNPTARRVVPPDEEDTLGWRPGKGIEVPKQPNWVLEEKLGEGGFGEVWRVRQTKSGVSRIYKFCFKADRLRALKREVVLFRLIRESLGDRDDVAKIVDWQFETAPYYIEIEDTAGESLSEWLDEHGGALRVPLEIRLEIVARAAVALAAAHSVGIIHKDVKPSNILVRSNESGPPSVRLMDFGIGLLTNREMLQSKGITDTGLTATHLEGNESSRTGTRLYAAPELLAGRAPSIQSDLYALGVLLYQLVSGRLGEPLAPGWEAHIADPLLREDIALCVNGDPEARLPSAMELAVRLRTLHSRRGAKRRRVALKFGSAASVVLLGASVVFAGIANREANLRREAERARDSERTALGYEKEARDRGDELYYYTLGSLFQKLRDLNRLDVMYDAADKSLAYFDAIPPDRLSPDGRASRARVMDNLAYVLTQRGDSGKAMEILLEAMEIRKSLLAEEPNSAARRYDLANGHQQLAYRLMIQGNSVEARENYRQSIALLKQLFAEEPNNASHLREIYLYSRQVGKMEAAEGKRSEGIAIMQECRGFLDQGKALAPDDPFWSKELIAVQISLARYAMQDGRDSDARALFEEALVLSAQNRETQPDIISRLFPFMNARFAYGEFLQGVGEHERVPELMFPAVEAARELSASNPEDIQQRTYVLQMNKRLAISLRELKRYEEAATAFDEAIAIGLEVTAGDPKAHFPSEGLATSYLQYGIQKDLLGEKEVAREMWEKAVAESARFIKPGGDLYLVEVNSHALLRLGRLEEAAPQITQLAEKDFGSNPFKAYARSLGAWPE